MIAIHPNYIIDEQANKKAVIIDFFEWEKLLEALEELEDIQAYDAAKAEQDTPIPFEQAVDEIQRDLIK